MNATDYRYSLPAKTIHMGLAVFGIIAYLTAEGVEHSDGGFGYQLHAYLGLTLMAFIILRVLHAYTVTTEMRFSSWSPFSKSLWTQTIEDVKNLLRLKMREHGMHEGLAGLVQTFGLIIFAWMGATGTALYFINESTHGTLFEISEMRQVKEKTVRQQATQIYAKSDYAGRHELAAHFIEDLMLENNK